jgi:hypothetical protein
VWRQAAGKCLGREDATETARCPSQLQSERSMTKA